VNTWTVISFESIRNVEGKIVISYTFIFYITSCHLEKLLFVDENHIYIPVVKNIYDGIKYIVIKHKLQCKHIILVVVDMI